MADPDTCSLTPPVSPDNDSSQGGISPPKRKKEDREADGPVCFGCLGEVSPTLHQTTHSQSYLQQGALESLMKRPDVPPASEDPSLTIELFGQVFVTQLSLDESMDTLFYLCRQTVDRVTVGTGGSVGVNSLLKHRHAIRHFCNYIYGYVLRHTQDDVTSSDSFIQRLLRHLTGLILYMGHVTELPTHVITAAASRLGNQSALPSYHMFHLHLDVRWSLIEVLHMLSSRYPDACGAVRLYTSDAEELCDSELFEQLIRLTLWDVALLALTTHAKMSVNDYRRQTPFHCACVKELLILIIKLLAYRNNKLAKPSFWGSFYPILQHLLARCRPESEPVTPSEADCSEMSQPDYACADPVGFCWWLLLHTAPLYQYDDYGVHSDCRITETENNYTAMQTLLKTMLSNRVGEGQLRCYLRCGLRLSELWAPNPDVVSLLWEHFYKRLNEHFRQSNLGVEGLATMCKSPSTWLDQCRQRCTGDLSRIDSDSSFNLFLRLLSVHLTTPPGGKVNNTWSRIKGRFYTKFHTRRMQELTEVGLLNFATLFLTLAMATDAEDVVSRMCALLSGMGALDEKRRSTVWRALFTAVLLYVETARDIGSLAEKLSTAFSSVCSELTMVAVESTRYTELAQLVKEYLDCAQEVIELSSSFTLNQHQLIGSGLKDVLKGCRETEQIQILTFCQAVLCKIRSVDSRSVSEVHMNTQGLSDRMWRGVLPSVRTLACSLTPLRDVADVGASFTLRSLNSPPGITTGMKEDFLGLFQYFGWNEQVNVSVSCRFLNHMLGKQSAMERLNMMLPGHETQVIAAWFRCCWYLPADNDQLNDLSRRIFKLSGILEMFVAADMELGEVNNAVHDFILVLGKTHAQITDLRDRLEFQMRVKTMLGDVAKHVSHALRPGAGADLRTAYLLGGLLAKHCAQLLYVKSQPDCVFPILLERLALPRILLTPNKPVPAPVLTAIRENLYMYLQGTSRLDFRRDPYIQRKVKDMVTQYLPRFPIKATLSTSVTLVHPIVAALSMSYVSQPPSDAILFRTHILSLVCAEFVTSQRATSAPNNVQLGLSFISEVLSNTKKPLVTASDSGLVLAPVLELVLQSDSLATSVFHQLLCACAKEESEPARADASHVIELFVNRHMTSQQARVMRTLEVTSEKCPCLLTSLIPALTGAVRAAEFKRGVGLDKQLRVAYVAILDRLGEAGQAERSALLATKTSSSQ